jgi:hypothetical protein
MGTRRFCQWADDVELAVYSGTAITGTRSSCRSESVSASAGNCGQTPCTTLAFEHAWLTALLCHMAERGISRNVERMIRPTSDVRSPDRP